MMKLGLIAISIISLIFTISCVSKEVQTTETYYETAYRTEPYVEIGKEHQEYISPKWQRDAPLYFKSLEWSEAGAHSILYGYEINTGKLSKSQIKIILSSNPQASLWGIIVINLTGVGPISPPPAQSSLPQRGTVYVPGPAEQEWLDKFNAISTDPKHFISLTRSDQNTGREITVDVTGVEEFAVITCIPWTSGPVIAKVQLIWSEEVIEDRLVPYQVEKERTVVQMKKVPFWEAFQTNPPAEIESSSPAITETNPAVEQTPPTTKTTEPSQLVPPSKLIYSDDFSNTSSGWPQESTEAGECYYKDGEFHGTVTKFDWAWWQYNRNAGRFSDFTLESDVRLVSGQNTSRYGLIFRCQDYDNFYLFLVSADGNYLMGTRLDGKWTELKRWTVSEYVEKDYSSNHLKVVCKGSQIEVYANGHYLTTIIDNSFADGYIGGIIDTSESNAHVAFDNLKVYSVD
jgi:predicted nucleic acid binding AN1-type Zn finger protein